MAGDSVEIESKRHALALAQYRHQRSKNTALLHHYDR